jgi:hypothetical protein
MGFKCSRLYLSLPHLYFKESQHTYFDIVYFPTTYDKNSVFGFFFTILTSIFHTRNMYDLHHTLSVMEYSDLDFYLFLPVSFILSYISMIAIFFFAIVLCQFPVGVLLSVSPVAGVIGTSHSTQPRLHF